jgi:cAMP phosphodiesterase
VESSAFFLRDEHSGAEIIVFGDIEPDSLSLEPRNSKVWDVAAPKIAAGILRAMFIECSFSDSVDDGSLYGHLCPRHLIAELEILASKVLDCQKPHGAAMGMRKRKREPMEAVSPKTRAKDFQPARRSKREQDQGNAHETPTVVTTSEEGKTTSTIAPDPCETPPPHENNNYEDNSESTSLGGLPLSGLRVFIIHVKDCLSDSPGPREQILEELRTQSAEAGLGCEFDAPLSGEWACV